MALVAVISWRKTRGEVSTQDGYFLAGRGLSAVFIAGSLLLTNLSAEQLIGLNGSAYGFNLSSMAWEVTAAVATVCMAFIFLPDTWLEPSPLYLSFSATVSMTACGA